MTTRTAMARRPSRRVRYFTDPSYVLQSYKRAPGRRLGSSRHRNDISEAADASDLSVAVVHVLRGEPCGGELCKGARRERPPGHARRARRSSPVIPPAQHEAAVVRMARGALPVR